MGKGPHGSQTIDPEVGAPQADIFFHYKNAIRRLTALDKATRVEERQARHQHRRINPDNIEILAQRFLSRMPYKAQGCRYHSFVVYFSNLMRLNWVEFTGQEMPSSFQDHYLLGQPRRYFRITKTGRKASDSAWANPLRALYGRN
jgi:hypothetical protein